MSDSTLSLVLHYDDYHSITILDNLHFARISQAMSCLDSRDSNITVFAYDHLYQLLQHRAGVSSPSAEEA